MEYPELYEVRYAGPDNTFKTYGEKTTDKALAISIRDSLHAQGYKQPHIQYTFEDGGKVNILPNADRAQIGFRPEFLKTPILYGRKIEISMPNGEKRKSQFAICEAENILASHNEHNFSNTIGYPTITGENINDRNYKDDKNAQAKVIDVAQNLDPNILVSSSRTPSGTPIITVDGIVVSGNNRTMSIKLAIDEFPDQYHEYKKFLNAEAFVFGFEPSTVSAMLIGEEIVDQRHLGETFRDNKYITIKNPILVRIDLDFPEYNTTELSKYNKETKKSERPIDKAIKIGKMLSENEGCKTIISELVGNYETFSQFYSNYADQVKLRDTLISCNIITKNELAGFFDERGFNESGKELIENLLAGMVLSKDALIAGSMAGGRQFKAIVITSLPVLAKNASLISEFSLIDVLNKAFLLEKRMHDSGLDFEYYIAQGNMFDEVPERDVLVMNRLLAEGRNKFKSSIDSYNNSAIDNENASMFGDKVSKQEMFDTLIANKINPLTLVLINKALAPQLEKKVIVEPEQKVVDKSDAIREFKNMGDYKTWIEETKGKQMLSLTEDEIISYLSELKLSQLVGVGTKKNRVEKAAQMLIYQFTKNVPDNELTLEQYAIKKFIGSAFAEAMVYSEALAVNTESYRKSFEDAKKIEVINTKQQQFGLSDAITVSDIDKNVNEILFQYGDRKMAALQITEYLSENGELGKDWLKEKDIITKDQLDKYLSNKQSIVRAGKGKERSDFLKEFKDSETQKHTDNIIAMAIEQGAKMDKAIEEMELAVPKYSVGQHVKYKTGDINIENWYGIIKKIMPFPKEVLYRLDAFNVTYRNMDKEASNELYEVQLTPISEETYNTHFKQWKQNFPDVKEDLPVKFSAKELGDHNPGEVMSNLAQLVPSLSEIMTEGIDVYNKLRVIDEKSGGKAFPPSLFPFPYRLYSQYVTSRVSTDEKKKVDLDNFKQELEISKQYLLNPPSEQELIAMKAESEKNKQDELNRIKDIQAAAKEKYGKVDEIKKEQADFINSISGASGNYIAVLLAEDVSKENILLIKKVADAFHEVDQEPDYSKTFLKVSDYMKKHNFSVDAFIDKLSLTGFDVFQSAQAHELILKLEKISEEQKIIESAKMEEPTYTSTLKPYIAIYKGKQHELHAESKYQAQVKAAEFFKAKHSYDVSVHLAEETKAIQLADEAIVWFKENGIEIPTKEIANKDHTVYFKWSDKNIGMVIDSGSPIADGIMVKIKGQAENLKLSELPKALNKIKEQFSIAPQTVKATLAGHEVDMPIETAKKVLNLQKIFKSEAERKQNSMKLLVNDNWYKENPDKILGEAYQTSGRFGEVTKYKGKIESVSRIDAPLDFMQLYVAENPTVSFENETISEQLLDPQATQNIEQALALTKKETVINRIKKNSKAVTRIVAAAPLSTVDVYSFDEVFALNNPEISKKELQVFVWYKEQIKQPLSRKWYALANYGPDTFTKDWVTEGLLYHYRNELIPAYLYFSGNIWEKRTAVDSEKATIIKLYGEEVFKNQKERLLNVFKISYDKRLTLDDANVDNRLKLLPISKFANQFMVKTLIDEKEFKMKASPESGKHPGRPDFLYTGSISDYKKKVYTELSLTEAFQYWLVEYKNEYEIKKGDITYAEIITVYINQRSRPGVSDDASPSFKKEQEALWQRKVNITKEEGDRLFSLFLEKWVEKEDMVKIETLWNEKYNGYLPINYNKIPVAFTHAKEYTNAVVDIRPEKREAVAFLMNEGSECLAYDVGVGKTWSGLFSVKEFLDAGYCKRPFIVVPNQVYKQFLAEGKGLLPDVKFNDLYNLTEDYISDLRGPNGKIEMLPEGSISILTYEGFEKIGFSQQTADSILFELSNILDQNPDAPPDFSKKGQKKEAAIMERLKSLVGRGLRGTMIDIEDLGFDLFCSDEAHKMKKLFVSVKGEAKGAGEKGEREKSPYQIQSGGEPSSIALKGFMISQYILKNNNDRNVLTLTATPFTNSPLEIFSVLAFLAYGKLKEMGLNNLKTFFDTYVHATNELTINAKLKPERKQVVLGFNNLKSLQQLIGRFINYKTGESVKVKRPNKYVLPYRSVTINEEVIIASPEERIDTNLPLSPQQEEMMKNIRDYAEGKIDLKNICAVPEIVKSDIAIDDEETIDATEGVELDEDSLSLDEKAGVRVLRAMSFARNLALSPYLYSCSGLGTNPTAKQYVETSPKLQYVMECIRSVKKYHENVGTTVSGQVIYMDRGVEYFGLLKQYLIDELGYKEHEVGIIKSQMKGGKDAKEMVKNFFLGQKYDEASGELVDISEDQRMKICIGSSTIKEGINLQRHSTVLYNCFLDWNPTDIKQLEGRIWRQGNLYGSVRIVNPMMENSMDVFIFQKLEEKTARIAEIWNTNGETNTFNLQEFNPSEIKKSLISDPIILAEMELLEDKEKIQDEIRGVKNESERITKILAAKETFDSNIKDFEEWVSEYRPATKGKEKRVFTTLLALANDIMKKQTDAEGKKMEYQRDRIYNKDIQYSDKYPASRPYYYYDIVFANRTLQNSEKEYLGPKNLTFEKLPKYQKSLDRKIVELEEQMKSAISEESIKRRADYITAERLAMKVETVSVMDRVKEFEKLNYLLDHKQQKSNKKMPIELECPPKEKDGTLRIDKQAIEHLTKCISELPTTKSLHIDKEGEYTESRKKLHKKIRESFLDDVTCIKQNKPVAILTGGPPGAGKSHFLKNYAPYLLSKDIFHIDADEVRTKIPEYAGWNAQSTHFEVRDIVNEMIDHIGGDCHYDLVYDGTMNKAKKYYELINKLKSVGYDVFIIYLDIPREVSEQRVLDRYQRTGRFVPMDIVQEVFDAGHEALDQIKTMVSGYIIVDGLSGKVTSTGGEKIPQDRNYKQLTQTENFIETAAKDGGERAHKLKIAKAKASAQLQRIRILKLANIPKAEKGIRIDDKQFMDKIINEGVTGWIDKFNSWKNGPDYTNAIAELNKKNIDYTKWTDTDIFKWYLENEGKLSHGGPIPKEPWKEYFDKQESFELGTPVVHHYLDYKDEPQEESGEVVLNSDVYRDIKTQHVYQPKTVKGISLYESGRSLSQDFTIPNWKNVETFKENNERQQKGEKFIIKNQK